MSAHHGERHVIVNADDFGLSHGVNRGIIQAHENGIVTSASLMVRWPAAREAAEYAKSNPRLSLGLHLDLGEWIHRRGHWLPRYLVVPVCEKFPRYIDEVRRQLDAFRDLVGCEPTHMDSRQHFHRNEPVRSVALEISADLGIPLRDFAPAIKFCGHFHGHGDTGRPRPELISAASLRRTLKSLRPGITELGCHPAAETDFDSVYKDERTAEFASLCDPMIAATVVSEGLRLISFHDIPSRPHASLAASAFNLRGSQDKDSELVQRNRVESGP
jgi:predicted glycoside hydrolase/deacetylase ChbG (UPF0249 family)